MILLKDALDIMDARDPNGDPVRFSLRFVKLSTGEVISIDKAHRSFVKTPGIGAPAVAKGEVKSKSPNHVANDTRNIVVDSSGQVRKVKIRLITHINNIPVVY